MPILEVWTETLCKLSTLKLSYNFLFLLNRCLFFMTRTAVSFVKRDIWWSFRSVLCHVVCTIVIWTILPAYEIRFSFIFVRIKSLISRVVLFLSLLITWIPSYGIKLFRRNRNVMWAYWKRITEVLRRIKRPQKYSCYSFVDPNSVNITHHMQRK